MAIGSCDSGLYSNRADVKCETTYKVDGRAVYSYNQESGVLSISMSPGDLEISMEGIRELPETGIDMELPGVDAPVRFQGVKKVESIRPYMIQLAKPKGLISNIIDYFRK